MEGMLNIFLVTEMQQRMLLFWYKNLKYNQHVLNCNCASVVMYIRIYL